MLFARLSNGRVIETVEIAKKEDLATLFHPDLLKNFVECPADVKPNYKYENGTYIAPNTTKPDLLLLKVNLNSTLDHIAEIERLKYITPGVGQSMSYQETVNQALDYSGRYAAHLADSDNNPKPNDAEYLFLQASLGIEGNTVLQVAETITYAYLQWQQIGALIEAVRKRTKAAIDSATTVEEAQAIFDAVKWP